MVEENHNLIYWFIHKKNLEVDEWYDLFAIELCMAVQDYDESIGAFSTYYTTRCENRMIKEFAKMNAQKRSHEGMVSLNDFQVEYPNEDILTILELKEAFDFNENEILEMRYHGYTQEEIAEELGVSQSFISKILKKLREEYNDR